MASRPKRVNPRDFTWPAGFKTLTRNRGEWSTSPRWRPNPEIAQHPERCDTNRVRSPNVERNNLDKKRSERKTGKENKEKKTCIDHVTKRKGTKTLRYVAVFVLP